MDRAVGGCRVGYLLISTWSADTGQRPLKGPNGCGVAFLSELDACLVTSHPTSSRRDAFYLGSTWSLQGLPSIPQQLVGATKNTHSSCFWGTVATGRSPSTTL